MGFIFVFETEPENYSRGRLADGFNKPRNARRSASESARAQVAVAARSTGTRTGLVRKVDLK